MKFVNCLIWRQKDAIRNSILAVGEANFSTKRLHGKSCEEIKKMLLEEKGNRWDNLPTYYRQGSACKKVKKEMPRVDHESGDIKTVVREVWEVDQNTPKFWENRDYIDLLLP